MLRVSRRTDYALRVMIAIARAPHGAYVPAPRLGEEWGIPRPFLVKVVGDLRRSGLILTTAGRNGGIRMARPAESITLRHIVEAIEGPIVLSNAFVGTAERENHLHQMWERIQHALRAEMDAITLAALAGEQWEASRAQGPDVT